MYAFLKATHIAEQQIHYCFQAFHIFQEHLKLRWSDCSFVSITIHNL